MEEGWKSNFTNNTLGINRKFSSSCSFFESYSYSQRVSRECEVEVRFQGLKNKSL